MDIRIEIDPQQREPVVTIRCAEVTEEIQTLVRHIKGSTRAGLTGFQGSTAQILDPTDIIRIATEGRKVLAYAESGTYELRMRLYQALDRLDGSSFVRISQSEIINLQKVRHFDLSMSGIIRVVFTNGSSSFVARRYLDAIRHMLGMKGDRHK